MTYQNRSFSWTINTMGSEVEKIVAVPFWTINDTLRQKVKCECFYELLVVTVLSVSHLVAFIRVAVALFQLCSSQPCRHSSPWRVIHPSISTEPRHSETRLFKNVIILGIINNRKHNCIISYKNKTQW